MATDGELGLAERDLLVGSNDAANRQEFHAEKNNFASLGPLEKFFFGYWKLRRFLSSIENVILM
jgi:hypothetical protein